MSTFPLPVWSEPLENHFSERAEKPVEFPEKTEDLTRDEHLDEGRKAKGKDSARPLTGRMLDAAAYRIAVAGMSWLDAGPIHLTSPGDPFAVVPQRTAIRYRLTAKSVVLDLIRHDLQKRLNLAAGEFQKAGLALGLRRFRDYLYTKVITRVMGGMADPGWVVAATFGLRLDLQEVADRFAARDETQKELVLAAVRKFIGDILDVIAHEKVVVPKDLRRATESFDAMFKDEFPLPEEYLRDRNERVYPLVRQYLGYKVLHQKLNLDQPAAGADPEPGRETGLREEAARAIQSQYQDEFPVEQLDYLKPGANTSGWEHLLEVPRWDPQLRLQDFFRNEAWKLDEPADLWRVVTFIESSRMTGFYPPFNVFACNSRKENQVIELERDPGTIFDYSTAEKVAGLPPGKKALERIAYLSRVIINIESDFQDEVKYQPFIRAATRVYKRNEDPGKPISRSETNVSYLTKKIVGK